MTPEVEINGEDLELKAIRDVYLALKNLTPEAQQRTLDYVASRLGVAGSAAVKKQDKREVVNERNADVVAGEKTEVIAPERKPFKTFADLFDATKPNSQSDKALVAGYWLQICQGNESFDGFSVNKELKNLGQGLGNVTNAIEGLKNQKPALALQVAKSGKSKQARKTYKITVAGSRAVEKMIDG